MLLLLTGALAAPILLNGTRRRAQYYGGGNYQPTGAANAEGHTGGGYESSSGALREISQIVPVECRDALMFDGEGDQCQFSSTNIGALDLSYSQFPRADFSGADVRSAKFYDAVLDGARFHATRLDGASFQKASLHDVRFENAVLKGADFTGAKFNSGTSFMGADCTYAIFDAGEHMRCPSSYQTNSGSHEAAAFFAQLPPPGSAGAWGKSAGGVIAAGVHPGSPGPFGNPAMDALWMMFQQG